MEWRRCLPLVALSLAGGACASGATKRPPLEAAVDAPPLPADAGPDLVLDVAALEAPPPQPVLATVMLRPGSEKTLQHLDCVMNGAGEGVALWRESDSDGKHQVWTSQLPRDHKGWQPAQQLGIRATSEIDRLGVTLDVDGRALAVWNELDGVDAGVVGARFVPATGWSAPARIAPGWVLSLVGSPAGDAVAFGVLEGAPPTLLRYAPAVGWQPDSALKVERFGFFFASPVGRGVMLWNQRVGPTTEHELVASEYGPGGSWTAPLRLQEGQAFDHPFPMVNGALAADGSGLLVWNRGGELQGELWASASPAPGQWQPPHRLKDGEAALWTTTVLVREGGDGLVAWETGSPPGRKVWVALHEGGQWQPSVMLGEGSELVTGAVGPSGSAMVAWSTPHRMYARRYTKSGGWGATSLALGQNGGVADLCAGIDAQGRGWIMWISGGPQVLRAAPIAE